MGGYFAYILFVHHMSAVATEAKRGYWIPQELHYGQLLTAIEVLEI